MLQETKLDEAVYLLKLEAGQNYLFSNENRDAILYLRPESIPKRWCVDAKFISLGTTVGKVSPILVTLTSGSDFDFERSNVSLKKNKPDGVNPNSNDIDYYVRKNEGKILWFSADCYGCFQFTLI